jgi:hypothetical protein
MIRAHGQPGVPADGRPSWLRSGGRSPLIFNAQTWFGIDTRYNPIFMAMPFLQVACFLPFGLLVRKKDKATLASAHRPTGR